MYGARAARVGLPITLSAWRLSGCAIRVGAIRDVDDSAPLSGTPLSGYAIKRASASRHELHLDRPSLDGLLTTHGAAFDDSALQLLTGMQLKKGSNSPVEARPVILYCKTRPADLGAVRAELGKNQWLGGAVNADRILVVLWCAP
jgi:hypothetical protein